MTADEIADLCRAPGLAAAAVRERVTTREEMARVIGDAVAMVIDLSDPYADPEYRDQLTLELLRALRALQLSIGDL